MYPYVSKLILNILTKIILPTSYTKMQVKVKQSNYRLGQALRFPRG
jgi:hypothetical protein